LPDHLNSKIIKFYNHILYNNKINVRLLLT